jgi:hypothetical protein
LFETCSPSVDFKFAFDEGRRQKLVGKPYTTQTEEFRGDGAYARRPNRGTIGAQLKKRFQRMRNESNTQ